MSSCFVTNAAAIAKRKLEQKPKSDKKDKKPENSKKHSNTQNSTAKHQTKVGKRAFQEIYVNILFNFIKDCNANQVISFDEIHNFIKILRCLFISKKSLNDV